MTNEIHRPLAVRKGMIYDIRTINSEEIPLEVLKMIDYELHKLFKEFPQLKDEICEIVFENIGNDIARASVDRSMKIRLKLHVDVFGDKKIMDAIVNSSLISLTPKDGLFGFLKHEFIHMLEYRYCKLQSDDTAIMWNHICSGYYANEILCDSLKLCNLEKNDGIIELKISYYATISASEAIAEACSSNCDNDLIKTIKRLVKERWN